LTIADILNRQQKSRLHTAKQQRKPKAKARSKQREPVAKLHIRTRKILQYIATKGTWSIVGCQVAVSCPITRIATMIDVVCYDHAVGVYVLLEIKSGFSGYYHTGSGGMLSPFDTWKNSPLNQHQLQLAANKLLFVLTYKLTLGGVRAEVVRVDDVGVTAYAESADAVRGVSVAILGC
jgi:hypothetical protein